MTIQRVNLDFNSTFYSIHIHIHIYRHKKVQTNLFRLLKSQKINATSICQTQPKHRETTMLSKYQSCFLLILIPKRVLLEHKTPTRLYKNTFGHFFGANYPTHCTNCINLKSCTNHLTHSEQVYKNMDIPSVTCVSRLCESISFPCEYFFTIYNVNLHGADSRWPKNHQLFRNQRKVETI